MSKEEAQGKFKAKFVITNDAQESFHVLRQAFITSPMFCHFDLLVPI